VRDILRRLNTLPLAAVLVTAVDVEGRLAGPDLDLIDRLLDVATVPIIAAGGVTTLDDLCALAERGVYAAVIGMALYTGTLDPALVAAEFNT
jgi:phosphoribosylformimino-5-aminoimidazole carboxamide ribotide isomerase